MHGQTCHTDVNKSLQQVAKSKQGNGDKSNT